MQCNTEETLSSYIMPLNPNCRIYQNWSAVQLIVLCQGDVMFWQALHQSHQFTLAASTRMLSANMTFEDLWTESQLSFM